MINVWGSWCTACREEAPSLSEAAEKYASKAVRFLGIDTLDNDASAIVRMPSARSRSFLKSENFDCSASSERSSISLFGMSVWDMFFLLSTEGRDHSRP